MTQKTARLIIQGRDNEPGRRYHFDIPFPNGLVDVLRIDNIWLDPRPQVQQMPDRIYYVVEQLMRMSLPGADVSLVPGIGMRGYHLRMAVNGGVALERWPVELARMDQTVVTALETGLKPDGEDGHTWYNDPGLEVEVVRLNEGWMTNARDQEGQCRRPLPSGLEWPLLGFERHVQSWEHIKISDALRLSRHVLQLISGLTQIEGLVNFRIDSGELILEKGLAWTWSEIWKKTSLQDVINTATQAELMAVA